jgi:hypothetical protein
MRTKRFAIMFTVLGLLAALTTTAYAKPSTMDSTPNLVGTWKMKLDPSATSPETNETMQTFFADGNYLETNNNIKAGSTGHGVWIGAGNTYLYTFQVFTADENGQYTGKRVISATLHMDGPDHYTGKASADVIDVDGNVTPNVFSATFSGTRMEVELPELQ